MKTKLQNLKSIFFFHISAESIEADEAEFGRMLKKRAEDGGKCKVISVAKVESEIEVKEIVTLSKIRNIIDKLLKFIYFFTRFLIVILFYYYS